MNYGVNGNTPIAMLTVDQLRGIIRDEQGQPAITTTPTTTATPSTYVYGLSGIRRLFNVSHATAQKYKDGILRPAVKQCGRKIIVDANLAVELFNAAK